MTRFDKQAFVQRVKDLDLDQIVDAAKQEVYETESTSYGVPGAPDARAEGSVRYASFLKGLLFYLRSGKRPAGLTAEEFHILRPLVESLVRRGQLLPAVLQDFGPTTGSA